MGKEPIRLGFVGGGGTSFIGGVHRAAATLSGRYAITAACLSSDRSRACTAAAEIGIASDRCYADFIQMAAAEQARPDGIEAVAILTPNSHHYVVAKTFIETGVHIICEKPVTTNLADAQHLIALIRDTARIFAVAHAYTGYSTVHEARARAEAGDLGTIRVVQIEYVQSWLATALEKSSHPIARRRTDPQTNGAAGCVAAIGTHAFNLAEFVTGLSLKEVAADLTIFVADRTVPDNAHIMMRYEGGARGMMWISQVAPGHENDLRLRVYGDRGSLFWSQRDPDNLTISPQGKSSEILMRGSAANISARPDALATPAGHPEGFVEAFARFYRSVGEQIGAMRDERACDPSALWVPNLYDGARAVAFSEATLRSSERNGAWVEIGSVDPMSPS